MEIDVADGQTVTGLTLNYGDILKVEPGGTAQNIIINNGGLEILQDGGSSTANAQGTLINSGGIQEIDGQNVSYSDTSLMEGGSVYIPFITYSPQGNVSGSYDYATRTLDIESDVPSRGGLVPIHYNLALAGDYTAVKFSFSSGTGIGVLVTNGALCFCRGTRIETTRGSVSVESLQIGDRVITASGRARELVWLGTSAFIINDENRPLLIRRHAFPNRTPVRDLRVTAGHSFLFGDVLIPIGHLLNNISIIKDFSAKIMDVYHIELDTHDIVIAEGALAESYRDDGNREFFHQGRGQPSSARRMATCAPVVSSGPIVDRTRQRLIDWANIHIARLQSPTVRGNELVNSSIS